MFIFATKIGSGRATMCGTVAELFFLNFRDERFDPAPKIYLHIFVYLLIINSCLLSILEAVMKFTSFRFPPGIFIS